MSSTTLPRHFSCSICKLKSHSVTKCSGYLKCKKNLTTHSYVLANSLNLKPNDEEGFCASGIIPFVKNSDGLVHILMLKENRKGINGLNFIAGKRECVRKNGIIIPETSFETALHEFEEELGDILESNCLANIIDEIKKSQPITCFWSSSSKMALYSIEIPMIFLNNLIGSDTINPNAEAYGIQWINANQYFQYLKNKKNPNPNPNSNTNSNQNKKIYYHSFISNIFNEIAQLSPNNFKRSIIHLFSI
jgi:hypothetical protein